MALGQDETERPGSYCTGREEYRPGFGLSVVFHPESNGRYLDCSSSDKDKDWGSFVL